MSFRYFDRTARVALAICLIAVIALIDARVDAPITFGFLYLFPILLVGTVLPRWQIVATALLCTALADFLDPYHFTVATGLPQDILVFTSLAFTGLFAYEITRNHHREMENLRRLQREVAARREAEEQLEFLIDSSPVAILTMTRDNRITRANSAAHRLFGVDPGTLPGRAIQKFVPALAHVPLLGETPQAFRTEMQCRGERDNGGVFLANVFFSTYETANGPRLAALVVDASEDLREREETGLEQLMSSSRILVGAVSHEVRNVCGAIAIVHENLVRGGTLHGSKDFEALGALVATLNKIASLDLKQSAAESQAGGVDLPEILDDLRIVLDPFCKDAGITPHFDVAPGLPPVWAERHSLLQVLLNLTKNSERALEHSDVKRIEISAAQHGAQVWIRVTDSGPGLHSAGKLFQPFQKGADSTGLGLFVSRALLKSFRGELRHDPSVPGCSFVIELAVAAFDNEKAHGAHQTLTA